MVWLLLVTIEGGWQGQDNILGDKCSWERPRQRPSHVFPSHSISISYKPFLVQIIIIEDLSKDLTALLNFWHSWWKSTWSTYGVGHNSKPFRNWRPNSHLFLFYIDRYKDDLSSYTFIRIVWGWEACSFNWIVTIKSLLWHVPTNLTIIWKPISTTFMKGNALLLFGQLGAITIKWVRNHVKQSKNY